jgi:hypothetical protein
MNSESVGSHPRMPTASCLLVPRGTVSLFFTGLAPCWQSGPPRELQCISQYIHSSVIAARVVLVADRLGVPGAPQLHWIACIDRHGIIVQPCQCASRSDFPNEPLLCCIVLVLIARSNRVMLCVLARCIEQFVSSRLQN